MDTIGVNYYSGWYTYPGYPDAIPYTLSTWLEEWNKSFGKPFFMSEYGAGAVSGMHMDPPTLYTEDYQSAVLTNTWTVFDKYRQSFLMGELLWNFQDFESYEKSDRVNGNKKGVMTRQRQPKAAARLLRQRYLSLAQGYDTHTCPNGLLDYSQKIVYVN
ncbi:Beta-glucuronidase [Geodia barretti]|nr:Beta-glucuronidase [Geodia barretti]